MEIKRGRPKKRVIEKRTVKIRIGVTPLEYGLLKRTAKERNVTISDLIRGYLSDFLSP